MEYDIKVSVIVPVYDAEKYLEQCLDSIVNQTLKEIEIICVDDGSTDSSMEILNRFKENDPRITVLSQQNLFAGVARNNGKSHARGKYLVFWDSDDYFYETALEKMYSQCERMMQTSVFAEAISFWKIWAKRFPQPDM
ncbi:MAG: glycosyltransferase family 2 protein [Lachnospiraceae bacterium]|nr:glycosyltransferase family 2 protein [Lachnospiraceae bacterium]